MGLTHRFDVLDSAFELDEDLFIDASAGTGKTFTIEHLVIRYLLAHEISIDQILIVTFTKAATKQLKSRLFSQLETTEVSLKTGDDTLPYLAACLDKPKALEKIQKALSMFDLANIQTIHSFAYQTLFEHCFELGMAFEKELLPSFETLFSYYLEFLKKEALNRVTLEQLEVFLNAHRLDLKAAIQTLIAQAQALPASFENLKPLDLHDEESLESFFTSFKEVADRKGVLKPKHKILLQRLCQQKSYSPLWLKARPDLMKKSADPKVFKPYLDVEQSIRERNETFYHLEMITNTLAHFASEYVHQKAQTPFCFYEDYLLTLKQKLSDRLNEKIRASYRFVLVDEFQDTDAIQWEIFSRLFKENFQGSFGVVGDVKQSIYRFRKADVYTYLKAKESFLSHRRFCLSTNYRSSASLINVLNALFSYPGFLELPSLKQEIDYPSVTSGKTEKARVDTSVIFLKSTNQEEMIDYVLDQILEYHEKKIFKLEECMICVKDRYQGALVASRAQEKRLPYALLTASTFETSDALNWLLDFVLLLQNPQDKGRVLQFFTHRVFGYCDQEVEKRLCELSLWINHFRQLYDQRGLKDVVYALLEQEFVLEGIFAQKSATVFYKQLLEIAELLKPQGSLFQQICFLKELKTRSCDPPDHVEGIKIMTMHSSKGLEFSLVFPIGLDCKFKEPKQISKHELKELESESMRLLYVALTRAKEVLYLPICTQDSIFDRFLTKRFKTQSLEVFCDSMESVELKVVERLSSHRVYSSQRKELVLQKPWPKFYFKTGSVESFSSLANSQPLFQQIDVNMPGGTEVGNLIHLIFEKINFATAAFFSVDQLESLVFPWIKQTLLEPHLTEVATLVYQAFRAPLTLKDKTWTLQDVDPCLCLKELEFLMGQEFGFIKGFVDLFFKHEGDYYFLDWKTNILATEPQSYTPSLLHEAMCHHDYLLQIKLYREALERYLAKTDPKGSLKGAFYLFLRGHQHGVYSVAFDH